jgi:hypothetical protein
MDLLGGDKAGRQAVEAKLIRRVIDVTLMEPENERESAYPRRRIESAIT